MTVTSRLHYEVQYMIFVCGRTAQSLDAKSSFRRGFGLYLFFHSGDRTASLVYITVLFDLFLSVTATAPIAHVLAGLRLPLHQHEQRIICQYKSIDMLSETRCTIEVSGFFASSKLNKTLFPKFGCILDCFIVFITTTKVEILMQHVPIIAGLEISGTPDGLS